MRWMLSFGLDKHPYSDPPPPKKNPAGWGMFFHKWSCNSSSVSAFISEDVALSTLGRRSPNLTSRVPGFQHFLGRLFECQTASSYCCWTVVSNSLGVPSPFFPEILLFRQPSKGQGKNSRFLKRTMVEKSGKGINPQKT